MDHRGRRRFRYQPVGRRGNRGSVVQPLRLKPCRQRRDGNLEIPIKNHWMKMIVSNLQPLEITENANFLEFVKVLNPTLQIPTRSIMRLQLHNLFNKEKNELRGTLDSAEDIVLTCELWSSRAEDSYLTVGGHFVDRLGNLKSYMLNTANLFRDESATNIQNQLSAVMEDWGIKEKVHSVVRAGMPQLEKVKTKWRHMPCFASTLNGVCQDLLSDNKLVNVLRKCQNIVWFFKCNTEAERKLRETQRGMRMKQDELIMYSGDRWPALLPMLQSLIQQYSAMLPVLDERGKTEFILNENDKKKMKNIISALQPLREVMSMMKGEGFESVSVILPLLRRLMEKLEEEEQRKNDVAQMLLLKCREKFGDVNRHKLASFTFLDPRFKDQLGDQNTKQVMEKIMEELSADMASSAALKVRKELHRYRAYKPNAESSNPLAWWRFTGNTQFRELSKLALKKLGAVSTAVPLERAFSGAGDHFCKLRSCIEPENLNMILFLHSNKSAVS
ncbi:zinc finger BED domain-containing protein RICESLEEPER 1 [Thunnus albacares]|uniref:zinc finger BED domain-containing protein RICESLEEPER 1 n=1 Tax=Thunnus albacares TaxID=8236 RepID=UPI001CF6C494|nr:zinc finger BED domain-containing protein RICESLEEPER 1 [Thunnus albacares]